MTDIQCKFCHKWHLISGSRFICATCDVSYVLDQDHNIVTQAYFNSHPVKSIVMFMNKNMTIFSDNNPQLPYDLIQKPMTVKGTWPDTKPEDAEALLQRLLNLKAFL